MKKYFIFITLLSIFCLNAQIQDLAELSTGRFTNISPIYDNNDDLYGYVTVFKKDKNEDKSTNFEAILLDVNLNKVSNVSFKSEKKSKYYFITGYNAYMNINDEIILRPKIYYLGAYRISKKFIFPESKKIDFKNKNSLVYTTYCLNENNTFKKCSPNKSWKERRKEQKSERKEKGYIYYSSVLRLKDKSFLVNDYQKHKYFSTNEKLKLFDKNQNLLWEYVVENNGTKKNGYNTMDIYKFNLENNEDKLFIKILNFDKYGKSNKFELVGLKTTNGEEFFRKDITDKLKYTSKSIKRTVVDNQIIDIRKLYNKRNNTIGFRRMITDIENNTIKFNDLLFEDLKGQIDRLNKYGKIGNNYKLKPKTIFVNKDGSVYILTEEFKMTNNVLTNELIIKNKNFYLIKTNTNFGLDKIHEIHKDKSRKSYSDFLFWQTLDKNNNDIAFFYSDKRKDTNTNEKKWILGICTIINGEFKNEEIPISSKSKKYIISPFIAKRGYIMLHEFNKKEEYNQVRLEKLNY